MMNPLARRAGLPTAPGGLEKRAIERALARHGGTISQAAETLRMTQPALYRRMTKHRLQG
jgi:DNA-binding NtrC family response regulator